MERIAAWDVEGVGAVRRRERAPRQSSMTAECNIRAVRSDLPNLCMWAGFFSAGTKPRATTRPAHELEAFASRWDEARRAPCAFYMIRLNQSIDSSRREHGEQRRDRREQRGDLGLLLLEHEPRVERLVDLLQVGRVAGVEVLAAA